jgi:glycosyltransferase involved in cell wall biosynthesis
MRIRTVPAQPHCFLYGGLDIQMVRTNELLRSVGIDARPLDWWSRDESFDILHVWGLTRQHQSLVRIAKNYGKKVVMTPLLPYLSPTTYLRHWAGLIEGRRRLDMDILRHVDVMLVVNQPQAETAAKLYGFSRQSIKVIPTILDPLFFDQTVVRPPLDDFQNYVVCPGNILARKNQIRLAKAALQIGCPMVFVGNTMGGEEAYTAEFQQLVEANTIIKWYKWLSLEDIVRVMGNAKAIALPSFAECQPASGLEAVALQKPLLLANRSYAYQEFYLGATLVDPKSVESIAEGLLQIIENPIQYTPKRDLVNDCRPDIVALKLRNIFESLVSL